MQRQENLVVHFKMVNDPHCSSKLLIHSKQCLLQRKDTNINHHMPDLKIFSFIYKVHGHQNSSLVGLSLKYPSESMTFFIKLYKAWYGNSKHSLFPSLVLMHFRTEKASKLISCSSNRCCPAISIFFQLKWWKEINRFHHHPKRYTKCFMPHMLLHAWKVILLSNIT